MIASDEARLRLGLFILEERGKEPIAVFDSPKGGFREDGASLFSEGHHERTRSNGDNLLRRKFCLDKKKISSQGEEPREAVGSSSLEVFNTRPNRP